MAGSPLSTLNELQGQLDKFRKLAAEELSKGAGRDKDLVAQLQRERELLLAQIDRQTSGDSTMFMRLCFVVKRCLPQADNVHQHAYS